MTAVVGRQSLLRRILRNPETYFALFLQRFPSHETLHSVSGFSLWWTQNGQQRGQIWTDELQIYVNSGMTCSEFYSYVLLDSKPLNAAASGQKYYWRMSFDPEASTSGQTDWMRLIRPTEGWTCSRKSQVCPSLVSLDLFYICTWSSICVIMVDRRRLTASL